MGSMSLRIKGATDLKAYPDVAVYYNWINDCMRQTSFKSSQCVFDVYFSIGKTSYKCDTVEEFKSIADGKKVLIVSMSVSFYDYKGDQVYFKVESKHLPVIRSDNVFISCPSQSLLNEILDRLS